jgi:hypothetical protein
MAKNSCFLAYLITTRCERPKLWACNLGLVLAHCTPPTCAVDIDQFNPATSWLTARGLDEVSLVEASDAVGISSGREGSSKLLYRLPTELSFLPSIKISNRQKFCILDFVALQTMVIPFTISCQRVRIQQDRFIGGPGRETQ